MYINDGIIDIHIRIMDVRIIKNRFMDSLQRRMDIDKGLTLLPFNGRSSLLRAGCLNVLGPISSDDFYSHFQRDEISCCRN